MKKMLTVYQFSELDVEVTGHKDTSIFYGQ
jgi:hypothetical protein